MIYEIKTYYLIGKDIRTVKERPDLKVISSEHGQRDRVVDSEGVNAITGPNSKLTTSLGTAQNRFNIEDVEEFLPYFADVTEDIPGHLKFEPNTYKNCQLMTETHGPYLQFFDHKTEKTLRIAINSNTYSPL